MKQHNLYQVHYLVYLVARNLQVVKLLLNIRCRAHRLYNAFKRLGRFLLIGGKTYSLKLFHRTLKLWDDERFVEKSPNGNFINTFIRRAELQGKIGSVELEANENLPINWTQQREVMMQLLQGSNPEVMDALTSPENIPLISRALCLDEFVIPGESDRQKQYEEIRILLESEPTVIPIQSPQGMMQQEVPSVDIEPLVDFELE